MRLGIAACVIAALLGAAGARALAGPDEETLAQAKQHYERGKDLYKQGQYDAAIAEFREADRLRPSPILAYNIGLAFEKLGDCKQAIAYYERYLREQPSADNRADTEQKIAAQRAELARGECPRNNAAPGPPPQGSVPFVQRPPPPVVVPPGPPPGSSPGSPPPDANASGAPQGGPADQSPAPVPIGMHPWSFGVRFGPVIGGLGTHLMGVALRSGGMYDEEQSFGLHLRASLTFPLLVLSDGRSILQGEAFSMINRFGFNDPGVPGFHMGGAATLWALAFNLRGEIPLSSKVPIALVPAIGFGLGAQFFSESPTTGTTTCEIHSTLATALVNIDIAARYELAEHHAFYFSPANLYLILPALNEGTPPDLGCLGTTNNTVPPKQQYGLEDTHLNYGIDFGYLYQF